MGRKSTSCRTCQSIKARCTQENPCARCHRLSIPCQYGPGVIPSKGPNHPKHPRTGHKTKHTKSATGCLNCRKRRRKCDEKQPTCSDCARLGLECVLQSGALQPSPTSSSASSPNESLMVDAFLTSGATSQSQHSNTVSVGASDCSTRLSSFSDLLAIIDWDNRISVMKTARLANSTALVSLGIPCAADDEVGLAMFLPSTALCNLTGVTPQALKTWTIPERHLLNHFLQSVSRAMAITQDRANPWLCVIVPMALESTMVQHALVTLSACHLSKVYPDFSDDVYVHRSIALQSLMKELAGSESSVWALAATLLLCFVEICLGDSRKWLLHLHGARALLDQLGEHIINSALNSLIEMYNYISCIASVTSALVPGKYGNRLQIAHPINTTLTTPDLELIHPLFGLSESLYECLAQINNLAARCQHMSSQQVEKDAEEIRLALQVWDPPNPVDASRSFTEARAIGFALQWAADMRLLQVTKQLKNNDPQITKASDNILSALSLIRPGSEMEARILFPLFMAGVGSMTKPNRLTVEYRLDVMESSVGFGNIAIAHQLLDEIWTRANQGETLDWAELMRAKYPGLIFF
ncbi:fungal-specific transcription factor domain-containing protein [Xylariales sp. PMI_506]|nr:fungal-specific transcription factor domain-containing protein [Xylariales sp. PMI_506]